MKTITKSCKRSLVVAVLLSGVLASPDFVSAEDLQFINSSGGNWNTASNWSGNRVPGSGDNAWLDFITANSYTVTYSSSAGSTPWGLRLNNGSGNLTTLNINAAGFSTANAVNVVRGVININSGGNWETTTGRVNIDTGSTVFVNGGTFRKLNTNTSTEGIIIGRDPIGPAGSTATLRVDSGSFDVSSSRLDTFIYVGHWVKGALEINGGAVTTDRIWTATDGNNNKATAGSNISMTNGTLAIKSTSASAFRIGNGASSIMNLSNGSVTNEGGLQIMGGTNGNATINQTGGTWTQKGNVQISTGNISNQNSKLQVSDGSFTMSNASRSLVMTVGSSTNDTTTGEIIKTGGTLLIDNIALNRSGALQSGANQTWGVYGNITNDSVRNEDFDMSGATINFLGSRAHSMTLAGLDYGAVLDGYANNFAIGAIQLSTISDTLSLSAGVNLTEVAALYVDAILLGDIAWLNNLTASNVNIYYKSFDSRNAYLGGQDYALVGGGNLIAVVPEPKVALLLIAGLSVLFFIKRKRLCNR